MFSRSKVVTAVLAAGAALSMSTPAQAYEVVSIAPFLDIQPNASAVGACNFILSGPSTNPSSTPFRIEGNASVVSTGTKIVVSTAIRCRLKLVSTGAQVGATLQRALPGNTTAVAGDVNVSSFGPFYLCTYVDAVFDDTSHSNPSGYEACRPLTSI